MADARPLAAPDVVDGAAGARAISAATLKESGVNGHQLGERRCGSGATRCDARCTPPVW